MYKSAIAGYQPTIYAKKDFFVNKLELERLNAMLYNQIYIETSAILFIIKKDFYYFLN